MDLKRMGIAPALLVVLLGMPHGAWGDTQTNTQAAPAEYPEWARQGGRCHYLMLESECSAMQQALRETPDAAERARLLAENLRLLKEREASCSCSHDRRSRGDVALLRQARVETRNGQ